jgi:hypothetical protein
MMPQEIGFAATYEAYRQFKYSTSVYNNLYTDYERQRDALRALAIAEGMSLSIVLLSLTLTCFTTLSSLPLVAGHGSWNRPIWLTDGLRCRGGDSRSHSY